VTGSTTAVWKVWDKARERAKLPDVRIHDLRHSFASVGASGGDSLVVIGALLGHRDTATTARYAHLSNDPLKAAADRIAGNIAAAMKGEAGKVVPLRPGATRKQLA
jgi:integrase